jgi:hypothetical protein
MSSKKKMDRFEIEGPQDKKQGLIDSKSGKRYNNAPKKKLFQKVSDLDLPDREIQANEPDLDLPNNSISTSKYNLITFLPKNLLEQFSKSANVYFLVNHKQCLAFNLRRLLDFYRW